MSEAFGGDKPFLDAALEGKKYTAAANSTTPHYFNFDRECTFNGIEIYCENPDFDDEIELLTEYTIDSGTTWVRYKKFGKTFNVAPNMVQRYVLLPAKPSAGVRVRINYKNAHATNAVRFWVNYYKFYDYESVAVSQGASGEDW